MGSLGNGGDCGKLEGNGFSMSPCDNVCWNYWIFALFQENLAIVVIHITPIFNFGRSFKLKKTNPVAWFWAESGPSLWNFCPNLLSKTLVHLFGSFSYSEAGLRAHSHVSSLDHSGLLSSIFIIYTRYPGPWWCKWFDLPFISHVLSFCLPNTN